MIEWPIELVTSLARRRAVIVIGSGVSRNSKNHAGRRPKTWEEFLQFANQTAGNLDIIDLHIQRKDFLTACELVKVALEQGNKEAFINLVQEEYQRPGYQSADIHQHIYNLDQSIVISPYFDVIYDTYARTTSAGSVIEKLHSSPDTIKYISGGENRLLIKSHGSANSPDDVIFTRADYARARTKHQLFYALMRALVLTHTFFFIGCGIDDPDIRMLFEDIQYANDRMPYHYMTLPKGEVDPAVKNIASISMKISFLEYDSVNGHEYLTNSLKTLVGDVEVLRDSIKASGKW